MQRQAPVPPLSKLFLHAFPTTLKPLSPGLSLGGKRFVSAADNNPLQRRGGWGASGLAARLAHSGKSSGATCYGAKLPADGWVFPRSRRCSQSPTTTAPAPRRALLFSMAAILIDDVRVVGCPRQPDHSPGLARRTLRRDPRSAHPAGAGASFMGLPSLGGGGRACAPTPPLRCAIPPTPWRSAEPTPRLAAGQPFPLARSRT